jgi:hypothetical protein
MAHTTESQHPITVETKTHTIEVSDGCLTIGERTFPDNCVSLSLEETQAALALLAAQAAQYETPMVMPKAVLGD